MGLTKVGTSLIKDDYDSVIFAEWYPSLQDACDSLVNGGTVFVANDQTLSTVLNINYDGITILSNGKKLTWTALGAGSPNNYGATTAAINVKANNFTIDNVVLVGPQSSATYVANAIGIEMLGTNKTTLASGLTVKNCEMYYFGAYGIFTAYVENINIFNNNFHDIRYAACNFDSSNHGKFYNNTVKTITPGTSGNMYGISLGAYTPSGWTPSTGDPYCSDWDIYNNWIEDIAWEGIDAHGGYYINVYGNKVFNTKQGIAISTNSNNPVSVRYGGADIIVQSNIVDSRNPDGTTSGRENLQYGINVNGGGAVGGQAVRVKVLDNIVLYKGIVSNNNPAAGAIQAAYINDIEVSGNSIEWWGGCAIAWDCSTNAIFKGNMIQQLADAATETYGYGFWFATAGYNPAVVCVGNTTVNNGGTTAKKAFVLENSTRRPTVTDNDFSDAAIQISLPSSVYTNGNNGYNLVSVTSGATTISLAGTLPGSPVIVQYGYASPVTVTNITPAVIGQVVVLQNVGAGTLTLDRSNAKLLSGSNWSGTTNQSITLFLNSDAIWYELNRSGAIS